MAEDRIIMYTIRLVNGKFVKYGVFNSISLHSTPTKIFENREEADESFVALNVHVTDMLVSCQNRIEAHTKYIKTCDTTIETANKRVTAFAGEPYRDVHVKIDKLQITIDSAKSRRAHRKDELRVDRTMLNRYEMIAANKPAVVEITY